MTERFVIVLDTAALDPADFASFAFDAADVTFTDVHALDCDDARPRFSLADRCVAFDASPADIVAYCDAIDTDLDTILPFTLHSPDASSH